MNWIKTSERLPPFRRNVLVYFNDGNFNVHMAHRDEEQGWRGQDFTFRDQRITHWMPLPPLPEDT